MALALFGSIPYSRIPVRTRSAAGSFPRMEAFGELKLVDRDNPPGRAWPHVLPWSKLWSWINSATLRPARSKRTSIPVWLVRPVFREWRRLQLNITCCQCSRIKFYDRSTSLAGVREPQKKFFICSAETALFHTWLQYFSTSYPHLFNFTIEKHYPRNPGRSPWIKINILKAIICVGE